MRHSLTKTLPIYDIVVPEKCPIYLIQRWKHRLLYEQSPTRTSMYPIVFWSILSLVHALTSTVVWLNTFQLRHRIEIASHSICWCHYSLPRLKLDANMANGFWQKRFRSQIVQSTTSAAVDIAEM